MISFATQKKLGGSLIAKQFFQGISGGVFARILGIFGFILTFSHVEIFAEIRHMFFGHRIRSAIFALVSDACIVADAIEADLKVVSAFMAAIVAPGHTTDFPCPTTVMAVFGEHGFTLPKGWNSSSLDCFLRALIAVVFGVCRRSKWESLQKEERGQKQNLTAQVPQRL